MSSGNNGTKKQKVDRLAQWLLQKDWRAIGLSESLENLSLSEIHEVIGDCGTKKQLGKLFNVLVNSTPESVKGKSPALIAGFETMFQSKVIDDVLMRSHRLLGESNISFSSPALRHILERQVSRDVSSEKLQGLLATQKAIEDIYRQGLVTLPCRALIRDLIAGDKKIGDDPNIHLTADNFETALNTLLDDASRNPLKPHNLDPFLDRLSAFQSTMENGDWVQGNDNYKSLIAHILVAIDTGSNNWDSSIARANTLAPLLENHAIKKSVRGKLIKEAKSKSDSGCYQYLNHETVYQCSGDVNLMVQQAEATHANEIKGFLGEFFAGQKGYIRGVLNKPITTDDFHIRPPFICVKETIEVATKGLKVSKEPEREIWGFLFRTEKDPFGKGQGLYAQRCKELQDFEQAKKAWEKSLIGINDVKEAMSITPTEVKRWIGDNRIPVAKTKPFHKWGQSLETTLHDPALLDQWKLKIEEWREQDNAIKTENRKAAQAKAKVTRAKRDKVREKSKIQNYPSLFPIARGMKRNITLIVGPTNSGKTFRALAKLTDAETGVYAAPLRLMASENQDRIKELGKPCSLVTGEEVQLDEGARHIACTVEMIDTNAVVDVAVIDECQMILDEKRGWAWTQAIVGMPSKELVLTGSPESIGAIRALVEETGDNLTIEHCERLSPLDTSIDKVNQGSLKKGDAVICFSRRRVMQIRAKLLEQGRKVATIYGSLSPEVRRKESARFNRGEADILVATDAIGMGLNLPIKRVVFAETKKFDGKEFRRLRATEIRQIAGRAGRYGSDEPGRVGLIGATDGDIYHVRSALTEGLGEREFSGQFFIMPPLAAFRKAREVFETESLTNLVDEVNKAFPKTNLWQSAFTEKTREQASIIEKFTGNLLLEDQYRYLAAPVKMQTQRGMFANALKSHAIGDVVFSPKVKTAKKMSIDTLEKMEKRVHDLDLYIWFARHFPEVYPDSPLAEQNRRIADEEVLKHLKEKALKKLCEDCMKPISMELPHRRCDDCFHSMREDRWYYY